MTNDHGKTTLEQALREQANRLEQALREHEAREKAGVDAAADVAPDLERLAALRVRLERLPKKERRQVLDAAGLQHVSAAPKPIETMRGSSHIPRAKTEPARWQVWRLIPAPKLWQAVALSLNIEPSESLAADAMRRHDRYSRLPTDFFERLMVCKANLSTNGPIRPQGTPYSGMLSDPRCPVSLADVAAFLARSGLPMPDEMRELVPAVEPSKQETKEEREDRRLKSCEDAGLTMPESHVGRLPDGIGKVAEAQGVTRQAFSDHVKAALKRREESRRAGGPGGRAR